MNDDVRIEYDANSWTYIPRDWPGEFGRTPAPWAKSAAKAIEGRSSGATREQRNWIRGLLAHLAALPELPGGSLYMFLQQLGDPFALVQVNALASGDDRESVLSTIARLDDGTETGRTPDAISDYTATSLGAGRRATFTTDDGEGADQLAVVWAFLVGDTAIRISTVANYPANFAIIEPELDRFIDGVSVAR